METIYFYNQNLHNSPEIWLLTPE